MKHCFLLVPILALCIALCACTTVVTKGPLDKLDWLLEKEDQREVK